MSQEKWQQQPLWQAFDLPMEIKWGRVNELMSLFPIAGYAHIKGLQIQFNYQGTRRIQVLLLASFFLLVIGAMFSFL